MVRCRTCDSRSRVSRSRVRIPPLAAVYQRQLSVPSLWGQLMSTSESWGVNGHTTRCISPVSMVLQLQLVSGWGLQETEISTTPWALRFEKGLYFFLLLYQSIELFLSDPIQSAVIWLQLGSVLRVPDFKSSPWLQYTKANSACHPSGVI